MTIEQDRYIKVLDIINELNRTHRQGSNDYYDCGELGIVHIYWWHSWTWEWIELSTEFKEQK